MTITSDEEFLRTASHSAFRERFESWAGMEAVMRPPPSEALTDGLLLIVVSWVPQQAAVAPVGALRSVAAHASASEVEVEVEVEVAVCTLSLVAAQDPLP